MQHAFLIAAAQEEGVALAHEWIEKNLDLSVTANPDVVTFRFGLFSVADARRVAELASGAPFLGSSKAILIAADRAYHEAQNALLKLFEEPPANTYLFLILPTLGSVLPTLRSRSHILHTDSSDAPSSAAPEAAAFLKMAPEKRSIYIKKLASGKDEDERREHRETAIAVINGIEAVAAERLQRAPSGELVALLADIAKLRDILYDRSAPLRMILEHLSLVIPKNLL